MEHSDLHQFPDLSDSSSSSSDDSSSEDSSSESSDSDSEERENPDTTSIETSTLSKVRKCVFVCVCANHIEMSIASGVRGGVRGGVIASGEGIIASGVKGSRGHSLRGGDHSLRGSRGHSLVIA